MFSDTLDLFDSDGSSLFILHLFRDLTKNNAHCIRESPAYLQDSIVGNRDSSRTIYFHNMSCFRQTSIRADQMLKNFRYYDVVKSLILERQGFSCTYYHWLSRSLLSPLNSYLRKIDTYSIIKFFEKNPLPHPKSKVNPSAPSRKHLAADDQHVSILTSKEAKFLW